MKSHIWGEIRKWHKKINTKGIQTIKSIGNCVTRTPNARTEMLENTYEMIRESRMISWYK
jgi:hypothetical protein